MKNSYGIIIMDYINIFMHLADAFIQSCLHKICIFNLFNPLTNSVVREKRGIHHVFAVGLLIDSMAPIPSQSQAYSTWYSQAVSHPSTYQARPCLASEIRRDRRPGCYGRNHRLHYRYIFFHAFPESHTFELALLWASQKHFGPRLHLY